jgi:hypothetical protein
MDHEAVLAKHFGYQAHNFMIRAFRVAAKKFAIAQRPTAC